MATPKWCWHENKASQLLIPNSWGINCSILLFTIIAFEYNNSNGSYSLFSSVPDEPGLDKDEVVEHFMNNRKFQIKKWKNERMSDYWFLSYYVSVDFQPESWQGFKNQKTSKVLAASLSTAIGTSLSWVALFTGCSLLASLFLFSSSWSIPLSYIIN